MKCPICEKGQLTRGEVNEEMLGISLGKYEGLICTECGESFLDDDAMEEIEKRAKKLGIWGPD